MESQRPRPTAVREPLSRRLVRPSRALALAMGLLAVALAPGLARLETDNSPEVFFVRGSASVERYGAFRAAFGSDETVRLVVDGPGLWSESGLRWLGQLEERAAGLAGVVQVSGLAAHYRRQGWPPRDVEAFRARVLGGSLDRAAGWVDGAGEVATVLVQIEDRAPPRLLVDLEALAADAPEGLRGRVLGLPPLNRALDLSSREIQRVFFPLLVVFAVVLLALAIRDPADLWTPLLFVGFCQLLLLAPMGYAGASLNLVLAVLPPLVFAISLALSIHLLLRFRRCPPPSADRRGSLGLGGRALRAAATLREMGWSVLWTGVTTAIGFASLALSPVAPIRSLGLWASAGLLLATLAAFVFFPSLVVVLGSRRPHDPSRSDFENRFSRLGELWGRWARRRRAVILAVAGALALVALAGLPGLYLESNALRYLAPDHPLRRGIEDLEARGIGIAAIEALITLADTGGGAPPAFVSGIEVDRLADLGTELEQQAGVFGVVSAGAVLRDAARFVPTTPLNAAMRPQIVLEGLAQDDQGRQVLASLLSADRRTARLTVFTETAGAAQVAELAERIRGSAEASFPGATVEITGEYPLLLEAQNHLIATLVKSFGLTLVAVGLVLRLLLPSTRLALLALLPNLWPVLGVLGVMGWTGIPLDIATVMVASVVLGLAVDDTIHTLGHFRRLAPRHGAGEAVALTLRATTPAYVLTGAILMAGFGVCGLSDFAPISRFGSLSAVAVLLAVIGDLLLLPALLSLTPDKAVERLGRRPAASVEP